MEIPLMVVALRFIALVAAIIWLIIGVVATGSWYGAAGRRVRLEWRMIRGIIGGPVTWLVWSRK